MAPERLEGVEMGVGWGWGHRGGGGAPRLDSAFKSAKFLRMHCPAAYLFTTLPVRLEDSKEYTFYKRIDVS